MLKTKVMEDLDALLADLQSTTSHIASYQQVSAAAAGDAQESMAAPQPPSYQSVNSPHYATVNFSQKTSSSGERLSKSSNRTGSSGSVNAGHSSREQSPPPVPPHPPAENHVNPKPVQSSAQQPIYEPTALNHQHVMSSYQKTYTYSTQGGVNLPQAQFAPPAMPPPPKPTTALSSNLSELDMLLQDLSSAQFMAEVDRRNQANLAHGTRPFDAAHSSGPHAGESHIVPNHYEAVNRGNMGLNGNVDFVDQSKPTGSASNATKELDDLMVSLSDFKVSEPAQQRVEPPYAQPNKPHPNQHAVNEPLVAPQQAGRGTASLDNMLGNLNSDMSKQGIMTVPKGSCAACTKPIVGQVITALGKIWHPEHFQCTHCTIELGTQNFFERDGVPYCEKDYHHLFSPMCAACNGPILDKCITALDKSWHPEHFTCASCDCAFEEEGFHEKDGKAYCREDYFKMFAPKCGYCSGPIMDNYISALNRQWHPECFVCMECGEIFGGGSFFDHDGLPYCETHYHAKRGSLCAGCNKPITGRCITAMYKKFHPEHFVCAFCLKQLNKGTFKEQNDKPYCHPCFVKLFG